MLIRIATAECFTHGKIAAEIHSFSMEYPLTHSWRLCREQYRLSLVAGLFIPTITGVQSILGFTPLEPVVSMNDIKIYNQEQDCAMAELMAESVKKITGADIGIGTTAGIGKGGIALVYDNGSIVVTSDNDADLRTDPYGCILNRQDSGITKTLLLLEKLIEDQFSVSFRQ